MLCLQHPADIVDAWENNVVRIHVSWNDANYKVYTDNHLFTG